MDPTYYYTARDVRGAAVRGSIQASTASAALANLRMRSLFVTSLENAQSARGTLASLLQIRGVSRNALVTFFRCFATLVRAGVPMRRSLDVGIDQCADALLREALRCILCDVENGLALSEAMARHPRAFPRLYVAMLKAGELGGVLDDVLERIAGVLERDRGARKRLAAALTYPLIVSCSAAALVLFLLTSIVPMFRSMYDQMHVPLPPVTAALIGAGVTLQSPLAWAIAAAALLTIFVLARMRTGEHGARVWEAVLFALPVAGTIARKTIVARFARMLGTLLRSGVALVTALEIVPDVVESARYRASISALRQALKEGSLVCEPLARSGLYDPLFVQMIRAGEETGALDAMLLRAADYYDLDVETMLSALGAALEPAMILLLGGAVGFIVAAIFIPLYTLIGNLK